VIRKIIFISFIAVIFYLEPLCADEITLKNGQNLTGKVLSQKDNIISFEIYFDSIVVSASINKDDILNIELDNSELIDESTLFEITQQSRGLILYKGRWLPKKHVATLMQRQDKIDKIKRFTLLSIQFFIFLMVCFGAIIGLDLLNFGVRKYKLWRVAKTETADNRLHRRIPVKLDFCFKIENGVEHKAVTTNISLGGLLFSTELELKPSDRISVKLSSEDNEILELEGLVVRSEKDYKTDQHNIGVSFLSVDHEIRQEIAKIIAKHRI